MIVNTGILVASSVTFHYAHRALERENQRRFLGLLGTTLALGLVFLAGQAYEYYEFVAHDGFTLTSGLFGTAFFGLTGLHGLHVALGIGGIAVLCWRAIRGHYGPDRDTSITTVSLYWHFVDAVWLFLVVVLYVARRCRGAARLRSPPENRDSRYLVVVEIRLEDFQRRCIAVTEMRLTEGLETPVGPDLNDADRPATVALGRRSLFLVVRSHWSHL